MRSSAICAGFLFVVAALSASPSWGEAPEAPEDSAKWDFEAALRMWKKGYYGGLLFYHDGRGPFGTESHETFLERDTKAAKPEEWNVTSVDCSTDNDCNAMAFIRFTDEEVAGLRRYRLVREPGQFWGLYSEEMIECPEGYRLQYQGICMNIADERADDPEFEVRTADPVVVE